MRCSAGLDLGWARLALMGCVGALALCAPGHAHAAPVSACPGVGISAYDGVAIIDPSSPGVECVLIPGAALSMSGATAPVVNFGTPASGMTTTFTYDSAGEIIARRSPRIDDANGL